MNDTLEILSIGVGVQSSTLALMAEAGEILPKPDAGIFADTKWEPANVYKQLKWIRKQVSFPIYIVEKGDLGNDLLKVLRTQKGRCGTPPFFIKNTKPIRSCIQCGTRQSNGRVCEECGSRKFGLYPDNSVGTLWRQCTHDYKIVPIQRKAKELMIAAGKTKIRQWIGISTDEAHRMKESRVSYIENVFPLIDKGMSRQDCIDWIKAHKFPTPPKSACVFCPYHNDDFWRELKKKSPREFERAVQFERAVRKAQETKINGAKIHGQIYLHRQCVPLDKVKFKDSTGGQVNLFGNECEGMCGV